MTPAAFTPAAALRKAACAIDGDADDAAHAFERLTLAHGEALLRLALAAEYRDDQSGVHIVRLGLLAEALALALGQPPAWAALVRCAAPLHDVGKIGIPDHVLQKPGALTPAERVLMNTHPQIGAQILGPSEVPMFALGAEVALTHHERFGGGGYPHGLVGEAIPLSGRIVCVVDYFDALTMERPYRPAFGDRKALEMLSDGRGTLFDPSVAQAFLDQAEAMLALRDRVNAQPPHFSELLTRAA
jgi:putative two-component system response regulator